MIARPASPYRSANAGEFSDDASGRIDIKQYYSGALAMKNVEPVPQSGFRQMGGTWRRGRARGVPFGIAATGLSVTPGPHAAGAAVVWQGTVAGTVAGVLVNGLVFSAGSGSFVVQAETSPGVWTQIGLAPFVAGTTAVTRLAAFAPGAGRAATAVRIVAVLSATATVTISSVLVLGESGTQRRPRHVALTTDDGLVLSLFVSEGWADVYTIAGWAGAAWLPAVTAAMLPDLDFYAEGQTVGLFHGGLQTLRLFTPPGLGAHEWQVDLWPYDPIPKADLGGTYPKTADVWSVVYRWTGTYPGLAIAFTVNGETTAQVVVPYTAGPGSAYDWAVFDASAQAALEALPGLGTGVTYATVFTASQFAQATVTFGGDLAGVEYEFSALILNTSDASALAYHAFFGTTDLEALFSIARGWPGTAALAQDRMVLGRLKARSGALALSAVGEYFDFNTAAAGDAAARLDAIRSVTNETVLHVKESKYLLVFTSRGVYFATNRTIERNTPLNFILASEIGAQPNAKPFDLEGTVYYVAINEKPEEAATLGGNQLLSIVYDDVSTSYNADPQSLLASHLVARVIRSVRQKATSDLDASKGWLMRADGRLAAAQFIESQDILGFCEWIAADGGAVREIGVDGYNRLWLTVERAGVLSIELYDPAIYLQDAVTVAPDLAGGVAGLPHPDGTRVYALADGYDIGPFTVAGGAIALGDTYASAIVGRWQPPLFRSMRSVYVTPGDDVVIRPGRIHTAYLRLVDTTSVAVGANGGAAADVPLVTDATPADAPMPGVTGTVIVPGLLGMEEGPTLTITQTRPGRLRIRDYATGEKL